MSEQFREAMRQAGIDPPNNIQADGQLHRFHIDSDRARSENGWYIQHADPPAGAFGCWKRDIKETWCGTKYRTLTAEEKARYKANIEAQKRKSESEQAKRQAECRKKAKGIWNSAAPAPEDHPYLVKKNVNPHNLRIYKGALVVPVSNVNQELVGLQFIGADGSKTFLTGTDKSGGYHFIGGKPELTLYLSEGFATAASIHEATDQPVAVCFDAGNLKPVARIMREKFPNIEIIIGADNDRHTDGNPGLTKATEAAQAVGGLLTMPSFPEGATGTDFNDLAAVVGIDEVHRQIEAAEKSNSLLTVLAVPTETISEPTPLPDDLLSVEPFDYALLPEAVRPWVRDICERLQCPPDFVAVAVMAALGSLIGRKVGIRPQSKTDWTVTPNQWALVVGRPGVMKSPAIEQARAPIKRIESQALELYQQEMELFESSKDSVKLRREAAMSDAKILLKKDRNAEIGCLLKIDEPQEPTLRRYTANDTSAASLGELLRLNPNGLLVFRDELVSLLKSLDREDQAEGRGFYLTGWNGDSSYTIDRIGRGLNLHIPAVCISLLGGTQPGKIAEYVFQATQGGSNDDGLLQRFGLLVWPDVDREWKNVDRWPDTEAKKQAFEVFNRLANLDPADVNADQDVDLNGNPDDMPYLRFSPDALEMFVEWRTELEHRLRSDDLHPALESHFSKYRKLIPGLALIIHLADGGTGNVSKDATLQALAWSDYLESHARRVYGSVTNRCASTAKEVLKRITKGDLTPPFSSRDVWRPGWSKLSDRKTVQQALEMLVDYQWLIEEVRETGGRPATVYHLNQRAAT